MLDFTELSRDGTDLELMTREILENKDLEVYWSGKGTDNGRDLICIENTVGTIKVGKKRWVVQCKDYAVSNKAVGVKDLDDISGCVDMHNAEGYLLVCTTFPSSSLVDRLEKIEETKKISIAIWDSEHLKKELLKPNNLHLINSFMPKSAKKLGWRINGIEPGFWYATFEGHSFYISSRLSANVDPPLLTNIEDRINEIEALSLSENYSVRIRAIHFDGKHSNYLLYLDLLVFNRDRSLQEEVLSNLTFEQSKKLKEIISDRNIDGAWYDIDLNLSFSNAGNDHFDIDHQDFYRPFLSDFQLGAKREEKRNRYLLTDIKDTSIQTEDFVMGSFDNMVKMFKSLNYLSVVNSFNCRVESVSKFTDTFDWKSPIFGAELYLKNFFDVILILECPDFEKLKELVSILPQSISRNFELTKKLVVLPDEGLCDDEEDLYIISINIHGGGIKNEIAFRKEMNSYLDSISESIGEFYNIKV